MIVTIDARMVSHSGIGTYLRELIPLIVKEKEFFLNLMGSASELGLFTNERVRMINTRSRIYSIREQIEVPIKSKRSDIFWSPHYNIPLAHVHSKRRIVTIHDVFHLAFSNSLNIKQKLYSRLMMKKAVMLSDKVITVSEFSKSEIVNFTGASENRVVVIHNGVDSNEYKIYSSSELFAGAKKLYRLPEKFILFVGNVKPHKNLRMLLKAFERLLQGDLHDHYLVIVGKKEGFITEDQEIFRILENNTVLQERVLFTGFVDGRYLPLIYNLASLFVFPSLYEGFGLPPLEAMSCGCPAVVSDISSLREICGNAACYVNPYDLNELIQKISMVLRDEEARREMVAKGLNRAKLFSWKQSAERHIRVFKEVLNN